MKDVKPKKLLETSNFALGGILRVPARPGGILRVTPSGEASVKAWLVSKFYGWCANIVFLFYGLLQTRLGQLLPFKTDLL